MAVPCGVVVNNHEQHTQTSTHTLASNARMHRRHHHHQTPPIEATPHPPDLLLFPACLQLAPAAPAVTATATNTDATVQFSKPTANGAAINSITVALASATQGAVVPPQQTVDHTAAGPYSVAFYGLTRGAQYTATVTVVNSAGQASSSASFTVAAVS